MSRLSSARPQAAPPPPEHGASAVVERFYEVMKTAQVPRGASAYTLPMGKIISSRGYNIDELRALGVPLEERDSGKQALRATLIG